MGDAALSFMRPVAWWSALLLSSVALSGCAGTPRCTPGAQVDCACGDGARGFQVCAADGTFGACACPDGGQVAGTLELVVGCAGDGCGKSGDLVVTLRDGGVERKESFAAQTLTAPAPLRHTVTAVPSGEWALDVYLDVNRSGGADDGDVVSGEAIPPVVISGTRSTVMVTLDALVVGCAVTQDCALGTVCGGGRCVEDPGGYGTSCVGGSGCAGDGRTMCLGPFVSQGPICTRTCQSNDGCPRPYSCQTTATSSADGGASVVSVCLPLDALGTPCRNHVEQCDPRTAPDFCIDPTHECTRTGEFCLVPSGASWGGCGSGDGCQFASQTGCAPNETCHPAGAFELDNTKATLCLPAGAAQHGAPCAVASDCAPGLTCIPSAGCRAYCTPDAGAQCLGVVAPDGGPTTCAELLIDRLGRPLPAGVSSIPAGVCF